MKKRKKHKKYISSFIILFILLVGAGYYFLFGSKNNSKDTKSSDDISSTSSVEEKSLKIIDITSKTRPYAIMINNLSVARPYQSGLQEAYIVYELIVEGGITRFLALYKDADVERIGSIRSARHYYLDYALENDAIYVHWGQSPQAAADFKSLGVTEISDRSMASTWSFRDRNINVSSEHTLFGLMSGLDKVRDKKISRKTSDKKLLLNYSIDEYNYEGEAANEITINYSKIMTAKYEFDNENKVYARSVNGKEHVDYVTKKQYTFKNIIAYEIRNYDFMGAGNKGRQEIENIGSGSGYYFSNGIATKIKWSKSSRSAQTKYETEDGKELIVNDGNTFIQIYPQKGSLSFK